MENISILESFITHLLFVRSLGIKNIILALKLLRTVIAGELEGSWLAGGQQEGLQYSGEAAGWKVISDIFL